ncbi:MAG: DUF4411 family protein [Bacteroidota bacterium]|nr:DUF4411 family protein [Bacteroidota bacterium]
MGSGNTYVCDTASLINLFLHFPKQFKKLKRLAENGTLKIPEGVHREIQRHSDKLHTFVDRWEEQHQIVIPMKHNPKLMIELPRIEQTYGEKIRVGNKEYRGFWKSAAGRKAADGLVVAVGKVYEGYIIVSDDQAVQMACFLENVPCIGWTEFARRVGLSSTQTELFS